MNEIIIIVESQIGIRLDSVLSAHFGLSRSFFEHLFHRGEITKPNDTILKKSYRCKLGDTIHIHNMNRFDGDGFLAESPKLELPILYETQDYAIIYKPKGVYSHPTSIWEINQPSVVGFLYHHYGSVPTIGNFVRAGLLHRLDKETDGLMIVALSEVGLAHFRSLFHDKSSADMMEDKNVIPLKKRYRCTVQPTGTNSLNTIFSIKSQLPYIIDTPVLANVPGAITKDAISIVHSVDIADQTKVGLELEILTGRTHQIRIHCANVLQSPIIGDTLYGNKKQSGPMMLTAFQLSFTDPTGQTHNIQLQGHRHDSKSDKSFVHNGASSLLTDNVMLSSDINM